MWTDYLALHLDLSIDWPFNLAHRKMGTVVLSILQVAVSLTPPFIHPFSKYLLTTYSFPDNGNPEKSRIIEVHALTEFIFQGSLL